MKKFINITVVIMLMIATTGVSISKHYCHNTLISSSLFGKAKSCCDSNCGACHNETIFNKVADNYLGSDYESVKASQVKLFSTAPLAITESIHNINNYSSNIYAFLKAPPPKIYSKTPEFLEVFRC